MYSTCLFCTQPLGSNKVLEHFPVGRRIAFDGYDIGAIADSLLLPPWIDDALRRMRGGSRP